MCGIFASLAFEPDTKRIDIVSHRGPDGRGWKVMPTSQGPLALGHRRLAIIDLDERASQPMAFGDDRYWMVYNGEIYNYRELREELRARGATFRTESDSEVLLQAYATWGEAALDKLLGMFSLIIWDARDQVLFAARDRFGIKPLFFFNSKHGLAFSSEIKQLLDLPGGERRMNLSRTWDFLCAGYTDHTDETMFAGVRQLRGGQCVRLGLSRWRPGDDLPIRQYYDIPRGPGERLTEQQAAEKFREIFLDSVKLHLRSDVRVGSCLSGGLDSSSIVSVMDRQLKREGASDPIHTVSACYPNKEVDEKPFMDIVVANTRTEPHFIYPGANDAFDLAEKITWHQDEPYGSTSIYSQWSVFDEARKQNIKVMLDGQGADEQLAGYHGSFWYYAQSLINDRRHLAFAHMVYDRWRKHGLWPPDQLKTMLGHRAPAWAAKYARRVAPVDRSGDGWMGTALLDEAKPASGGGLAEVMARDGVPTLNNIGELSVAFVKGASLPMLLRYEDRNSMAHSIEARVPFLDHRLVEFNISLWDQHKIVAGDTKRVLRSAMRGILPEPVRTRHDKLGFATPESAWFRGALKQKVIDGVEETLRRYPSLLNPNETRALMNAALAGRRAVDFTLWRIVNLGIWGRVYGMSA
jgi:asparagine synthase (glutamine-hydrolysing)